MASTYNLATGDGSTTHFAVSFPYIAQAHVTALVNGVSSTFTWVSSGVIAMLVAPAAGTTVKVMRTTPTTPLVVYQNATTLNGSDLNTTETQALYVLQEAQDAVIDALGPTTDYLGWNARGRRLEALGAPVATDDAATKAYVDGVVSGAVAPATSPISGVTVVNTAAGTVAIGATTRYLVMRQTVPAAVNINLPTSPAIGYAVRVDDDAGVSGAYPLTVVAPAGLIRGNTSFTIAEDFGGAEFRWNGTTWTVS